jgi:gamma-glutamylcyclotransferase (GGCT)/AIG2-like uncharacterized protein YtfP
MSDWYFAYGSNMNPERMSARGLLFSEAVSGRLPGFSLRFNKKATGKEGVAYANIVYAPQACVEGVLYSLVEAEAIELMDPFEGNPVRYSREIFSVISDDRIINAWVYVANPAMIAEGLLPEKRYLEHLIAGNKWHSSEYQDWLVNHPTIDSDCISASQNNKLDGLVFNV